MIVSGEVRYHDALADLLTPAETLRPHPGNPNNGDQDALEESILVNGMYRPVYAQSSTGYVLAGHTTYAACLSLGAEEIPVLWLDVDDETALRILLGDNQIARLAVMDHALLAPHLIDLLETELKLLGTGYREPPVPEPDDVEPGHTVSVWLTGERMVAWFDLPGDNDRSRLLWLLERGEPC